VESEGRPRGLLNTTQELRWMAPVNRLSPKISRIIPGDWGKDGPGWLVHPLINRTERCGSGGRIHQFLWRRSRAVSHAKRNCATRSDKKPLRIESSTLKQFRVQANGSYPEGIRLLLCISTGERLWRPLIEVSQWKDAERRDKVSVRTGKDTRPRQGP
jgi:hypothetical protein